MDMFLPQKISAATGLDPHASRRLGLPCGNEIFLWCLDLPSLPLVPMLQALNLNERRGEEQGRRYRRDFEHWLKARAALRCILGACTGLPPACVVIREGGGTKPELPENPDGLYFNAARSRNYALVGIGRVPLGIDIEAIRPDFSWDTVAIHWFHPRERMLLAATPEARRVETFFQIWTKKEAFFKALGMGLDREAMASCFIRTNGRSISGFQSFGQRWWVKALAAPRGYKAALSSRECVRRIINCTPSFTEILP